MDKFLLEEKGTYVENPYISVDYLWMNSTKNRVYLEDTPTARNDIMEIGRNVARLRKQKGMTQKKLAAKVGISREYLASIETGKERVSIRVLSQIAYALDVDIKPLLDN